MRLTGRGVFPRMGQGSFSTTGLGIGAQLGGGSLVSFGDFENVPPDYELDGRRYNFVAVDVDGSPSATRRRARRSSRRPSWRTRRSPSHDTSSHRRRSATSTGCASSPARWRACWRWSRWPRSPTSWSRQCGSGDESWRCSATLGFSRRQLHATVGWHASVIALAALAVGAPLGIALGRAVWRRFAGGLYASAPAETPWMWLARRADRDPRPRQPGRRRSRTIRRPDTPRRRPARRVIPRALVSPRALLTWMRGERVHPSDMGCEVTWRRPWA